ncbi:hypothetical protein WICMUC_002992 [Wickerhamomyces mucosus]|uniref:Uncharacterized protein n=1 Tax=Wickerhamomyces mucosus TaxID=1378264 RepID=A0A9P8PP64_9ASCO|nr:hypothetical protein WICMUC_002992 [Wickerhamomyces mucosus]
MSRVLFDLDSRHSYNKLYPAYETIYKTLDNSNDAQIPKYINSSDLMIMKKALENIRIITNTANRNLVDLENELVERAAELGNNDAVSILAFEAILDNDRDSSDKIHAKKLIAQLLKIKHPLTTKMSGDLCLKNSLSEQAEDFYQKFLELEKDTFLSSEVYTILGKLYFEKPELIQSKQFFTKAIRTGPLDKVVTAHYYLGQIYAQDDLLKSRYHFELCASQGFKESFQQLGFMELNYFKNVTKAKEWFKLGVELQDLNCIIGLFDCFIRLKEWRNAYRSSQQLEGNLDESSLKHFKESREKTIKLLAENYMPPKKQFQAIEEYSRGNLSKPNMKQENDRWSI